MPQTIDEMIQSVGLTRDKVREYAAQTAYNGNQSPQHENPPSKGKPGHALCFGDVCLVTKYCEAHDVLVMVVQDGLTGPYKVRPLAEDAPVEELYISRDGLKVLARADQVDSWDPAGTKFNSWREGVALATARMARRAELIDFCITAEKAMRLEEENERHSKTAHKGAA